jgi:hypothetical protein
MALTRITTNELSNNVVVSFANTAAFAEVSARLDVAYSTANTANTNASGVVPKITTVNVANNTYAVLDDTAVNVGGGYLVISGSGFATGAQVLVDVTPATSTTFVNSTTLRAEVPAKTAATYNLYVVNTDGGTGTKINGVTYSGSPTWVTGSTLSNWQVDTAANVTFNATGATSYSNTTALPAGTTLLSNGYFYGTVTGISSQTTYNFTIRATDAENQDSDRSFALTVQTVVFPTEIEYLVVAGGGGGSGGGGGENGAGGGGAGGYRTGTLSVTALTQYNIVVGSGGAGGGGYGVEGSKGANSSISNITSAGGGAGRWQGGQSGGSGGGRAGSGQHWTFGDFTINTGNTPATTPSQGNNGGIGAGTYGNNATSGGGGGGATGVGQNAPNISTGGTGGPGATNSISGSSVTYATGGNGATYNAVTSGTNGSVNTGNGATSAGGGGSGTGGSGGSGIVIVRYSDAYSPITTTTGSPTYNVSGGYRIYKFTGSGSITW